MQELIVISGKGGTGKTSIVASLAQIFQDKVLADCDVDAADLHLLLHPTVLEKREFWSGKTACLHPEKCIECEQCLDLCRFEAIQENFIIDKISCEGCGVCAYFCPPKAIEMQENMAGYLFISTTSCGPMIHAHLGTGEENSGKLVAEVRNRARQQARKENLPLILIDGPPGIGCPVIASLTGANCVLIITEPTLSGLHDLERVIQLTQHFQVQPLVCINKADLNPHQVKEITNRCTQLDIKIIGQIPYDEEITKAQIAGQSIIEFNPKSLAAQEIKKMAQKIKECLKK
ncbi:MAG: P-loop NTPase [Clostridia bacterium]|jgi:MinD superfamily P-loop ATPase|nr:P-loop NTPase [Clostridia bacterium]